MHKLIFQMQPWFPWPNAQSHSPPKEMPKIPSCEPKFQRKNENRGVLKAMKKVQNTNIRKWVFKEEKIKPISPKPIYTCFRPKQKPFVLWQAWREITKVREKIHEGLSEGELISKGRGAHRGRNALAASPQ